MRNPRLPEQHYPCPCGDSHAAVAHIAGWPIVGCPNTSDTTLNIEPGFKFLLTGMKAKARKR